MVEPGLPGSKVWFLFNHLVIFIYLFKPTGVQKDLGEETVPESPRALFFFSFKGFVKQLLRKE